MGMSKLITLWLSLFAAGLGALWSGAGQPNAVLGAVALATVITVFLEFMVRGEAHSNAAFRKRWETCDQDRVTEALAGCTDVFVLSFADRFKASPALVRTMLPLLRYSSSDAVFAAPQPTCPVPPREVQEYMKDIDTRVVVGGDLVKAVRAALERFMAGFDLDAALAKTAADEAKRATEKAERWVTDDRFFGWLVTAVLSVLALLIYAEGTGRPTFTIDRGDRNVLPNAAFPAPFQEVAERLTAALPDATFYNHRALIALVTMVALFLLWGAVLRKAVGWSRSLSALLAGVVALGAVVWAYDVNGAGQQVTRASFCHETRSAYAQAPYILTKDMEAFKKAGCTLPDGFGMERIVPVN